MFTEYFVKGSFIIKGFGGFFVRKNLTEKVNYYSHFIVDNGADVVKIATADLQKRADRLATHLNDKTANTNSPVSTYYGLDNALSREGNDWKMETYFYRSLVTISDVQVEVTGEQSIEGMSVEEARKKLTVAQWKRLMKD